MIVVKNKLVKRKLILQEFEEILRNLKKFKDFEEVLGIRRNLVQFKT
jgi:hypothetical protein